MYQQVNIPVKNNWSCEFSFKLFSHFFLVFVQQKSEISVDSNELLNGNAVDEEDVPVPADVNGETEGKRGKKIQINSIICDMIKQNESEVGQIYLFYFFSEFLYHLLSYILQKS